jgi:SAM-dependent methyltransferase
VDPNRIVDMASAFYESAALFAASDLGIFKMLAGRGQADLETVASACGLDQRGGRLLLDACVALGLLEKDGERYRNTAEASTFLVPDSPADLSGAIRYNRDVYAAWGRLKEMALTGMPVEKPEVHLGKDPVRTRTFAMAMHGRALGIGRAVVPRLDLAGRRRVLDVGGGPGTYSLLIAEAHPDIECVVIDLPPVAAIASEIIEGAGLTGRVRTLAGDYHVTPFPSGFDAALFFGVLHQESPEAVRDLLRRAYEALVPGGLVHVLDMMTDASRTWPKFSALFGVNMALTAENGGVFSDEDLGNWLTEAGFGKPSIRPLDPPMPHWLASARK